MCLKKIANVCFELGHWPLHFKVSTSIIIPKPNKKSYDSLKAFKPIILLDTIYHKLVVILELSGISEVQYQEIMIIGDK